MPVRLIPGPVAHTLEPGIAFPRRGAICVAFCDSHLPIARALLCDLLSLSLPVPAARILRPCLRPLASAAAYSLMVQLAHRGCLPCEVHS